MSEWKPISTAPKDIQIIVCGGTYSCEYSPLEFSGKPFNAVAIASYSIDHNEWADLEYTYQPTYWMPIPPLPQSP